MHHRWLGHPSRCLRVIERIARRRFVSFEEINNRIFPWYAKRYNYPEQFLWQHCFLRQIHRYWNDLQGVIGNHVSMYGLYCRLENGRRVDRQHCIWCLEGINPIANGKPKRRLCCSRPLCHDLYRWACSPYYSHPTVGQRVSGWTLRSRWNIDRDLRVLVAMTSYLFHLIEKARRDARQTSLRGQHRGAA